MTTKNTKKFLNLLIYVFSSVVFFVSFLFIFSTNTNITKAQGFDDFKDLIEGLPKECSTLGGDLILGSGNLLDFDGDNDKNISVEELKNFGGISGLFNRIIQILIWLSFIIIVIMLAYYGFLYILSGIKGDIPGKQQSKEYLTNIIIALLALLSSYIILKQVNPQLVEGNLFEQNIKNIQKECSEILKLRAEWKAYVEQKKGEDLVERASYEFDRRTK